MAVAAKRNAEVLLDLALLFRRAARSYSFTDSYGFGYGFYGFGFVVDPRHLVTPLFT